MRWFHSITARLLLFAAISVLVSVVGISTFTGLKFYSYLRNEFRKDTQRAANESANAVRSSAEFWLSSLSIGMHSIFSSSEKSRLGFAEAFLRSNTEFIALQVFAGRETKSNKLFAMTDNLSDVRFQDQTPKETRKAIRRYNQMLVEAAEKQNQDLFVVPLAQSNLPIMSIGMRFIDDRNRTSTWGILTVWQTRLLKSLPQTDDAFGVILDDQKNLLISPKMDIDWEKFKDVVASRPGAGVHTDEADGRLYISGQKPVMDLGMNVAVIKDATSSIDRINNIILNAVAWTSIYVLSLLFITYFAATGITFRLKRTIETTREISQGNFETFVAVRGRDEVSDLGQAVNQMAVQIKGLLASRVEAARQEKELETARLVQSTFFPKDQTESSMVTFYGKNIPASECGGDWWGRIPVTDRYEYILIADATGHGAGAALVTAMAYSGCMTLHEFFSRGLKNSSLMTPSEVLMTLNRVLWMAGKGSTSMTCLCALIDTQTGIMRFANAGHCMPIMVSAQDKQARTYTSAGKTKETTNQVFSLVARGDPLGYVDAVEYNECEIQLMSNDKLLLYTDGFLENTNDKKVPLGKSTFVKFISNAQEEGGEQLVNSLVQAYENYIRSQSPIDDVTVVVMEVKPQWTQNKILEAG